MTHTLSYFQSAATSTDGTKVNLTYSHTLHSTTAPPSAFDLRVDGASETIDSVATSGKTVILSLPTPIQTGQSVRLDYTRPSPHEPYEYAWNGNLNAAIQNADYREDSASLSDVVVSNNSTFLDSSVTSLPPALEKIAATSDGNKVILSYDQELSSNTATPDDFVILADGASVLIDNVSASGFDVELTLLSAIESGQTVSLDYIDPTSSDDINAIQELIDGTDAESLSNEAVINNSEVAPPVLQSAATTADGSKIILTYDQILSFDPAGVDNFSLVVDDVNVQILDAVVNGSIVELTPAFAINNTQSVFIDYTDPTTDDDSNAIQQSLLGTDADSFSNAVVTNVSTLDGTPPSFLGFSFPSSSEIVNVGGSGAEFNVTVEDSESDIFLIEVTFQSPDGLDDITLNIDPALSPGLNNVYTSSLNIPFDSQAESLQGGFWKLKSLKLQDSFTNERILLQDELPDGGFWVNNQPTGKQSIVGTRKIGETLTINPDTIADPDIDSLPVGAFAPNYEYQWQVSENGVDGWVDLTAEASYTLTKADANKFFRNIVSYVGSEGVITEDVESDVFQFTEDYGASLAETFEDGSSNGWKYAGTDTDAPVSYNSNIGHFIGRLPYKTTIEKTYQAGGGGTFSFDFLFLDSWDSHQGDAFSVSINDVDVLSDIRHYGYNYEKSIHNGETNGFAWSLDTTEKFNTYSRWEDMRVRVSIDLPEDISSPTIKITSKVNQSVNDESGGVDNINYDWGQPSTDPLFSSPETSSILERTGSALDVYKASATDRSGVAYSLVGSDPSVLSIDPVTGVVRLLEEADVEKRENYNFTVRATDPFGNFTDQSINLAVENSLQRFWKDGSYRVDSLEVADSAPSVDALSLKDRYNRDLSDEISRAWNGLSVIKNSDGYRMLQVGERGRRRGHYRIAELNDKGIVQSVGAWVDPTQAISERYQEIFKIDLNGDGFTGRPLAIDLDFDGLGDDLQYYHLVGVDKNVALTDASGTLLRPDSSRSWNAIAAQQVDDGFNVLIRGERGRRLSLYQVWTTDANGIVTDKSSWIDSGTLANQGFETVFNQDFNNDTFVGTPIISPSSDGNGDGFIDGLSHYVLLGACQTCAVNLADERGNFLSPKSSRAWNAVAATPVPDGFNILMRGERGRRRSLYQVWSADASGKVTDKSPWSDGISLAQLGYESIFNQDLNGNTTIDSSASPPVSDSQLVLFSDADSDGFVDGLDKYMLMGLSPSNAVDFTDERGRNLTPKSSRSWNAQLAVPDPVDPSSGFAVLIKGLRGRRRSQYQVWSTDANGQITSKSSWFDGMALAQQGYETIFAQDFNGDSLIGLPSGSSFIDQDNNGLVDGITHYSLLLGSGNAAQAIDLKDRRGRVLSDASSRSWNVIHAHDNGNGFDLLLQGERGRRRSQFLLWNSDQTGLITEKSRWQTGDRLAFDGYESVFGLDLNNNGTIGL